MTECLFALYCAALRYYRKTGDLGAFEAGCYLAELVEPRISRAQLRCFADE